MAVKLTLLNISTQGMTLPTISTQGMTLPTISTQGMILPTISPQEMILPTISPQGMTLESVPSVALSFGDGFVFSATQWQSITSPTWEAVTQTWD